MKKQIALSFFFFVCILSSFVNAQSLSVDQQKKVNAIFSKGSVVYFKFPVSSAQEVTPISKEIKVDKMVGTMVFAHATKDEFSKFIVRNYPYTVERYEKSATSTKAKPKSIKK